MWRSVAETLPAGAAGDSWGAKKSSTDKQKAETSLIKGNSETNDGVSGGCRVDESSWWERLISHLTAVTVGNYEGASMTTGRDSTVGESNFMP